MITFSLLCTLLSPSLNGTSLSILSGAYYFSHSGFSFGLFLLKSKITSSMHTTHQFILQQYENNTYASSHSKRAGLTKSEK